MSYVIGVDLGTGSVRAVLVNRQGEVCAERSTAYPLLQRQPGYSEQDPEDWFQGTVKCLRQLLEDSGIPPQHIEGISFSGQMHSLVLLDAQGRVLRPAMLWNDTRTTEQCRAIERELGDKLLHVARNAALEGFTLPKLLWVRQHEPALFAEARVFLLPKDYLRYRLTGQIHMDLSDAAGTLLLDVLHKRWSKEICDTFDLDLSMCPPLVESLDVTGRLLPDVAQLTGLDPQTRVIAGGADNACGAVGAGILHQGATLCSIGTSGVLLSFMDEEQDFSGKIHFFNHAQPTAYYAMGVTLAAGYSLDWLKKTLAPDSSFESFIAPVGRIPIGSGGILFTPYLTGERTPHADSVIRASFIGLDGTHHPGHMARAVMEGITFSLNESVELLSKARVGIETIISIGGGAKSEVWLQMQADIFNRPVLSLRSEQGPAMGAAMLAAVGCGWFDSLAECASSFVIYDRRFEPIPEHVSRYQGLYEIYKQVYAQTRALNEKLQAFRVQTIEA